MNIRKKLLMVLTAMAVLASVPVEIGAQADISNVVANSTATQSEDANTAGSMPDAGPTLKDPVDDVSGALDPDDVSKPQSGASSWPADTGFLFSITDVPEPADWMTLLCGFVVVAFMARRKTSAFAD
ncbi:MAG TPA: hypothetical protein VJT81_19340 [Burkholderiales bacterium]|nr:hypothetical protein [Burkholderiales bacterium]